MTTITTNSTSITKPAISGSHFQLKEPASAITHFIGMIASISAAPFLLSRAASHSGSLSLIACTLFILSMALLYGASASYHAIRADEHIIHRLKKLDHIMIYFLIAGSYSPVCLLVLPPAQGMPMFFVVWGLALAGLVLTCIWVDSPKWLNSSIYIAMGWICLFAIRSIYIHMQPECFAWLFAGGIIYTIGGIIYALKLPLFDSLHPDFGLHEIFHLFVMGGSLCHFIMIYAYLC